MSASIWNPETFPSSAARILVGKPDRSTDNTPAVQAALDSLGTTGGIVEVLNGARFNLQSLTFPQRANLEFFMDDDLSRPNPSTTLGTNERVLFQANANLGGIVNEHRVTASFHPSMNLDVRRDVTGHDAHLGTGQVRVPSSSNPARASWNIFDQQVDAYRTIYEIFGGDYSLFSGVTSHGWRRTVTITGVGTGAGGWVSVPSVGTEVSGSVSGAKGWFLSADTTTTTVLWNSGKFAAGDALTDNNETTVNTASSTAFAITSFQAFGQDLRRGNWAFGLPPGANDDLLAVGGRIIVLPTAEFGQHVDKAVVNPGIALADRSGYVPSDGFFIVYNVAAHRLTARKLASGVEQTTDAAHLNACRAHVIFGNAATISTSAFNIASITRTGTGRYDIVFTRAMERADYSVLVSLEEGSTKGGYPLSKTTAGFTLAVATLGGTIAVDLAAVASVVVFGGDI